MAQSEGPRLRQPVDTAGAVADRFRDKMDVPDAPKGLVSLPFEATLAYAFRLIGGKRTAIEGCRLLSSDHPEYGKIVWAYDHSSESDRDQIRLEDLCAAAEIHPSRFIGDITGALHRRNYDMSKLLAAASHESVVGAAVMSAMDPSKEGFKDREMLLQASGFIAPKGPGIAIHNSNHNVAQAKADAHAEAKSIAQAASGLPSFEEEVIEAAILLRGDAGQGSLGHYQYQEPKALPEPEERERIPIGTVSQEDLIADAVFIEDSDSEEDQSV